MTEPDTTAPDASEPGVRVASDAGVLHLCLDRPSSKNSLTQGAVRVLVDALEGAATDDSLRAVRLDATGSDFCAGTDLRSANRGADERPRPGSVQRRTPVGAHRLIEVLTTVQLPVVCAVRGWAAGLGCQLALAADFTIAADDATFWEPFAARGFTPDSGATWLLPRLVGIARAKELLMLGERISGADAAEWGMIHRSVPDGELDDAVDELTARLASGPTVALGLTKACIAGSLELSLREAMAKESFALEVSSRTDDFREGFAAFAERREPRYQGR